MEAGWTAISKKRNTLFNYMIFLIKALCTSDQKKRFSIQIITPTENNVHGCMLSIRVEQSKGKELFDILLQKGFVVDWREPDVIRIAPVPLYNTYQEVYALVLELSKHTVLV